MYYSAMSLKVLLLWSISFTMVPIYCQEFPYVLHLGVTLANHSYIDLSLVGDVGNNSVVCQTDLETCCSGAQGSHRGDWYFPNGDRLPFVGEIYQSRSAQQVDLHRTSETTSPTGVYRCDIPTLAINDATDISIRASIYVGLYPSEEGQYHLPVVLCYYKIYLQET